MTPKERDQLRNVFEKAKRSGADPLERADRLGLILTQKMMVTVKQLALWKLSDDLEDASIRDILTTNGRTGSTALDAQRAIVAWIRKRARELEE